MGVTLEVVNQRSPHTSEGGVESKSCCWNPNVGYGRAVAYHTVE